MAARSTLSRGAVALVLGGAVSGGCRSATGVVLEVTTDARCSDVFDTSFTVGLLGTLEGRDPTTATDACAPSTGRIGSLTVVPSDAENGEFAVRVVTGFTKSAEDCVRDGFMGGCIVARRALRFLPEEVFTLPIEMEASCIDVPCNASETCRKGVCVDATLPDPTHCTDPAGCDRPAADGGPDGPSGGASSGGSGGSSGAGGSGGGRLDASSDASAGGATDVEGGAADSGSDANPGLVLTDDGSGCPGIDRDGHRYMVCPGPLSWPDADRSCTAMGAHLLSVGSAEESDLVHAVVRAAGAEVWTGLARYYPNCHWVWDNRERFEYPPWSPPGLDSQCWTERCGLLTATSPYWAVDKCELPRAYVCERDPAVLPPAQDCSLSLPIEARETDGDGVLDVLDTDADNDGKTDLAECFPGLSVAGTADGRFDAPLVPEGTAQLVFPDTQFPGWKSSVGIIQVWREGTYSTVDGIQAASLNTPNGPATYWQDTTGVRGLDVRFSFVHRAMTDADTVRVQMGPPAGPFKSFTFTTLPEDGWVLRTGVYKVPASTDEVRLSLTAVDSGITGNLIDMVLVKPECTVDTDRDGCIDSSDANP